MTSDNNSGLDKESIMMTLDQLDQTIEIMTNVVNRLRGYMVAQDEIPSSRSSKNKDSRRFLVKSNKPNTVH